MKDFSHPNAQAFRLGNGRSACLLMHGFLGSPAHMRPLGEHLASHGFHARGILLPGHGTRLQDMDKVRWKAWLECAQESAARLREEYAQVYAVGFSMGGVLSLLLGEAGAVDAVVSMAAPIRIYGAGKAMLSRVIWPLFRYRHGEPPIREDFLDEFDYGYDMMPVHRVSDLLRLMRKAERGLHRLRCPLLVMQSYQDPVVRPVSADIIFARAASEHKELLMLNRSPHIVTLGAERETVACRTESFLNAINDKSGA